MLGGAQRTEPVRAAGRFAHESVAYEKHTSALYLSEDNFAFPSGFYRYLPPNQPLKDGRLADGGRLQMLRVVGVTNADLSVHHEVGATFDVDWVDIDDPDPTFAPGTTNDQAIVAVGNQGRRHRGGPRRGARRCPAPRGPSRPRCYGMSRRTKMLAGSVVSVWVNAAMNPPLRTARPM
jgi:Alkaline phosphatase PhoX